MTRRILERPEAPFALVFIWKVLLLVLSAQPVPSNDAFFYDGPVINLLLHGQYANPALALALPISGTEVFCAYPPLYQFVLLGWMWLFGISAFSAMTFHLILFGLCLLLLEKLFSRLNVALWPRWLAAFFLLVITFHDRPDSLAHLFGLAAIYCSVRFLQPPATNAPPNRRWAWLMAGCLILGLATGLQIGALYYLVIGITVMASILLAQRKWPIMPLLAAIAIPIILVAVVVFGFPHLWAGFLEHATQTPSLTGLRRPQLAEILKLVRTAPGTLAVCALLLLGRRRIALRPNVATPLGLITFASAAASLVILAASMLVLTANSVFFASFLQPIVVAGFFNLSPPPQPRVLAIQKGLFLALALVGSIRALGMSTWGLLCAGDISYAAANQIVCRKIKQSPQHSTVVLSSSYLYEAARCGNVHALHSDWLAPAVRGGANRDLEALLNLKPAAIILTQFDYYRRYQPILEQLKSTRELAGYNSIDTARIRAPDSFPSIQKVIQHVSWAPIVVSLSWR